MKCVYCPIDTRLNFHQVSKLLKEVQVNTVIPLLYALCVFVRAISNLEVMLGFTPLFISYTTDRFKLWFCNSTDSFFSCFLCVSVCVSHFTLCVLSSTLSLLPLSLTGLIWCWSCSLLLYPTADAPFSICPSTARTNVSTFCLRCVCVCVSDSLFKKQRNSKHPVSC